MAEQKKATVLKASVISTDKVKVAPRHSDTALTWVARDYPQLAAWRSLALEWLSGEIKGIHQRLNALTIFFERYLVQQGLPLDPAVFLARTTVLPDFYQIACPDSEAGIRNNNCINSFLHFVLLRECSAAGDDGQPVISPAFHNPVPRVNKGRLPRRDESVHSPLPYGYIDELRQMLAEGPYFRDWLWAQSELGVEIGKGGYGAPDWFEVNEEQIDKNDPDCVWRVRKVTPNYRGGQIVEMWSPVRWVALLLKLILPLRTFQIRVLDSGEADTWRYTAGNWALNLNRLAQGSAQHPL